MSRTNSRLDEAVARLDEAEREAYEVFRERFDTGESLILAEKATAFEASIYETMYEGFMYQQMAPVVSDGPGLDAVGYYSRDKAGQANFIADGADDLELLNSKRTKHVMPIVEFGAAYGWTFRELQKALRQGLPLESDAARDAASAMQLLLDNTFFEGGNGDTVPGILTHANKYGEVPFTNPGTKWSAETTDNLLQDLARLVGTPKQRSKNAYMANTVGLPVELLRVLNTRFITGTDTTIMDAFKKSPTYQNVEFFDTDMFYDKSVTTASGLKQNKNIVLAYYRSPEVIKYKVPVLFYQHPLERRGRVFRREVTGEIAGVEIKNATAFAIATTPKL
jgi:hypothetical protein